MPDVVPVPRMPRHHAETDSEAGSFGGESIGGGACSGKNAACGGSSGGSTLPADPPLSAQTLMSAPGHEPPESSTLDAPTRLVSPDELSEAERNHPFWRSGIGASALQRVQADEEGDRDQEVEREARLASNRRGMALATRPAVRAREARERAVRANRARH